VRTPWLVVLALLCSSCAQTARERSSVPTATSLAQAADPTTQPHRVLTVCADPNTLPFSNDRGEGFENKLAELIARDIGAELHYVWRAQRRGFFRHAFKDDGADVVMGVPAGFERALTTKPYYRSSYVFVTRKRDGPTVKSFDDEVLHKVKVGIQITGEDGQNPPPAYALARRGIIDNVVGYTVYGDYTEQNPPARVVDAVANREVDVAVVWGPLAGYFAQHARVPLYLNVVSPAMEPPGLPFAFSIAVGVRKNGTDLRDEIDTILARRRDDVTRILDDYGVPRVPMPAEKPNEATAARDKATADAPEECCQ
jgi:quinoprotein dehydrogenase-associated probable ABC transporter substrate-binding protein